MFLYSRSEEKLEEAKNEIQKHAALSTGQSVVTISIDITSNDVDLIETALNQVVEKQGPVFMLINCAGASIPGTLETLTVSQVKVIADNFFSINYRYYFHFLDPLYDGPQFFRICFCDKGPAARNES